MIIVLELEQELPDDVEKIAIDFGFAVDNLEVTGSPCLSSADLEKRLANFEREKIRQSFAYNQVYFNGCDPDKCIERTPFCKTNRKK